MSVATEERQQTINDVRVMLDWLEANPDVTLPLGMNRFPIWCWSDREQFLENARLFGTCEKSVSGEKFVLTKRFGKVEIVMEVNRDKVCTKRTVMKTVPVDEWDCEPLLSEKEITEAMAA